MPEAHVPTYRPLTEADLPAALYIGKAASAALDREQAREGWPWQPRAPRGQAHILRTDPEGSWGAEIDGLLVGYSQGFVRGDIWYLGQLFVQPEVHGLGIGGELLRRAQDYGARGRARVFAVISSTSPVAQALYIRSGMLPRGIAYSIGGPVDALRALPEPSANRKRVVDCAGWEERIEAMDRMVFGAPRPQEHAFRRPLGEDEGTSFAMTRDGELVGYGYAYRWPFIGPLAAGEPGDQLPLLRMAGDWLAEHGVADASLSVISTNGAVLRAMLDRGWKIRRWNFFLASEAFGQFDRYLPSGGLLL